MKYFSKAMLAGALLIVTFSGGLLAEENRSPKKAKPGDMRMMERMPDTMKLKARMMMNMEVQPTDPAALLAVGKQLRLSKRQTEKLQNILETARAEAKDLLKPDQQEKLEGVGELPATHKGMHKKMKKKMKAKMETEGGSSEKGMMMCPMMRAEKAEKAKSDKKSEMKKRMQERMKKKMQAKREE